MSENNTSSSGIGFTSLLTVLFVGLKLTHYIDWSWWWVTCPFWGMLAICAAVLLIVIALAVLKVLWDLLP